MRNDCNDVVAARLWYTLLNRLKVLPEVLDGLHRCTRSMVCPESARRSDLCPSSEGARVRTTDEHPGCIWSIRFTGCIERQWDRLREIGHVSDCLRDSEELKVLGGEVGVGRRFSPVTVLNDDRCSANRLGILSDEGCIVKIACEIAIGS